MSHDSDYGKAEDKDKDITTVIFQSFKKAEPIIILASISLAIGALVVAEQDKFPAIFRNSIISPFMFIFSFVFYMTYELFKKYWYPNRELASEEYSAGMYTFNMVRFAPIYFAVVGIIFLIIIAGEFSIGLTEQQVTTTGARSPLPIPYLTFLFFISYFLGYQIYSVAKNLIRWKRTRNVPAKNLLSFLLGQILLLSFFTIQEIFVIFGVLGLTPFSSLKDVALKETYVFTIYGIGLFIKHTIDAFNDVRKNRSKYVIIRLLIGIPIILTFPFIAVYILQGIGAIDKNFDLWEYGVNASKNILSQGNQTNKLLNKNVAE